MLLFFSNEYYIYKVSDIYLSNQQEFEQTPEIGDVLLKSIVWKGIFVPILSLI